MAAGTMGGSKQHQHRAGVLLGRWQKISHMKTIRALPWIVFGAAFNWMKRARDRSRTHIDHGLSNMLRIHCPVCGLRDETEFTYGGDASENMPELADEDRDLWHDFIFLRNNWLGLHTEYWHHVVGCRQWLIVDRDTGTHLIKGVSLARDRRDKSRL